MAREGKSERTIARDIERGRFPVPFYDENGTRFWWERQLDANDKRIAALRLGPKTRPPAPTASSLRKAIKKRIAAVQRRVKAERVGASP